MKTRKFLFIVISVICLLFSILSIYTHNYFPKITAIMLLFHNIYSLIYFKEDKKLFFLILVLIYFNYSIIICKYLFGGTTLLKAVYSQINNVSLSLNINLLFIFNCVTFLVVSLSNNMKIKDEKKDIVFHSPRILLLLKIIIIGVLAYHIIFKITYNTTIFEYLFIVFIFAFYLSKGNKKEQRFFEILMILCSIYQLYVGERISILQFLLVDFVINYLDKLSKKRILIYTVLGVLFFTIMGVYGDLLDYHNDFSSFNFSTIYSQFSDRRFALDTSVSSYFTSNTIVDIANNYSFSERFNNFIQYFSTNLVFGSHSGYINLTTLSRNRFIHYGGGVIYSYFYFWLGISGILAISIYLGCLIKKNFYKPITNNYGYLISVYILVSLPRWYLYEPGLLFRGLILFSIFYIIIFSMIKEKRY